MYSLYSMSFSRLQYDKCSYKKNLGESMSIGHYQMYSGKYDNKNKCRIDFGVVGGNEVSLYKGNLVDLESDLRGQTRLNSHCPSMKYSPRCQNLKNNGLPSGKVRCESHLINLPTCQIFCRTPTVYSEIPKGSVCKGLYKGM